MSLRERLLDLLYPPKCPFCGKVLDSGEPGLCASCQKDLPWTAEGEGQAPEFCDECLSPLWYRENVPDGVRRYKFGGGQNHARLFGTLMAQCLSDRLHEPADVITYAPLSAERLRERGYDQARLLAERVGALTGIPVEPLLEKTRNTGAQSHLEEASARRANVQGAYRVKPGAEVKGRRIVLVDDVVTTGSTLSECAVCLKAAGAASVTALTLARARK